ncbi:MAG: MFS transporter [Candidatus Hydrogenedentes bacterium]|nr:MFS transporter [Candidatus Hydrogenedentota bacterium]
MMFLQYFVNGCFLPVISHYLKNHLGFEPFQVGVIMAMPAIAAILAPFIMVRIADRLLAAERLLAVNHFIAAACMLALFYQKEFWPFLILYFCHGMVFVPTFALTNAVTFHHVTDAQRDFGGIRMWGPVSWVVVGWTFGYLWLRGGGTGVHDSRLPQALVLSAIASCVLAAYALTLPKSQVERDRARRIAPSDTFALFLRPSLLLLCALTFLNAVVHQFYYYGMSPFLSQIGLADSHIMPAMSMGQFGEMFVMAGLGVCLARLGVKRALVIGVAAQIVRCLVFAAGYAPLVLVVIPTHGVCYAFFFAVAYIYVDQNCSKQNRAGAQQLFNILIAGFGNLAGNLFAGKTAQFFSHDGTIDFRLFWLTSAALALVIAVVLALFFKPEKAPAQEV